MIGRVLKVVTGVVRSLESPDAIEYAVRLPGGTVLGDGRLLDREGQEARLARLQRQWPEAELVERPVWYGEWDPVP